MEEWWIVLMQYRCQSGETVSSHIAFYFQFIIDLFILFYFILFYLFIYLFITFIYYFILSKYFILFYFLIREDVTNRLKQLAKQRYPNIDEVLEDDCFEYPIATCFFIVYIYIFYIYLKYIFIYFYIFSNDLIPFPLTE